MSRNCHGSRAYTRSHVIILLLSSLLATATSSVQKRSDDASLEALHVQLSQLTSQVTTLTAQLTSQQNKVAVLESSVDKCRTSVAFFAQGGDATVTAVGKGGVVALSSVLTNVGNAYDRQTSFFTAPVSGLYQFIATFMPNDLSGTYVHAGIYVGSGHVGFGMADSRHGYRDAATIRALVHLTSGQKVHLGNGDETTAKFLGGAYLTFSGLLVRAD